MNAWIVKRGNTSQQDFEIQDKNGNVVTNLEDAASIKFQVKKRGKEGESPLISKTKGDGIEVDTPTLGCLRITLLPSDTDIYHSDKYVMACEIEWSSDEKYEVYMYLNTKETDSFVVKKEIVL